MNKKNQNWKLISNNFDTLISSENNVDVLKNGFLMLAVMGRFSTQQPHDEPVVLSINRMRLEKERIKNEGKLRASKNLEPIAIDEMPFDIPDSWSWVRLKDIVYLLGDGLH